MLNVFLSYSHNDLEIANKILLELESHDLENKDFSVFTDDKILAGQNYTSTVSSALNKADIVIVLLSKNSSDSKWLAAEVTSALDHEKKIIPVLLDDQSKNNWIWPLISKHQAISFEKNNSKIEDIVSRVVSSFLVGSIQSSEVPKESAPQPLSKKSNLTKKISIFLLLITILALYYLFYNDSSVITDNGSIRINSSGNLIIDGSKNNINILGDGNFEIIPKDK